MFSVKKILLKRAAFAGLVLVFLAAAVFTGCKSDSEPTLRDKLNGVWKAEDSFTSKGYTEYIINGDTLIYDDGNEGLSPYGNYSFVGKIKYVAALTGEASGVIIVQYTTPPDDPNFSDGFNAVYFKGNVSAKHLQFANAYTADEPYPAPPSDVETLQEAINCFTGAGYADTYIFDPENEYFTGSYFVGTEYYLTN